MPVHKDVLFGNGFGFKAEVFFRKKGLVERERDISLEKGEGERELRLGLGFGFGLGLELRLELRLRLMKDKVVEKGREEEFGEEEPERKGRV